MPHEHVTEGVIFGYWLESGTRSLPVTVAGSVHSGYGKHGPS